MLKIDRTLNDIVEELKDILFYNKGIGEKKVVSIKTDLQLAQFVITLTDGIKQSGIMLNMFEDED